MIVKLKSMRLKNWKGSGEETYQYSPGINDISLPNGEGKTRQAEAFTWAFWGKDLMDRVNYRIKNERQPELRKFDSTVTLDIDMDSKSNTLERIYAETWVRPRGQEEEILKGNTTAYVVNGDGSLNKGQFESLVNTWFSEITFKLLTNPLYFNNDYSKWNWESRRNLLIQLAGEIDNQSIFDEAKDISQARRKVLEEVLAQGKTFDAYKREIAGKKKEAREKLEGIPQSIKKLEEVQPEKIDWDALDDLITAADEAYALVNDQFNDKSKGDDDREQKLVTLRKELRELREAGELIEGNIKRQMTIDNNLIRTKRQELSDDLDRLRKRAEQMVKANEVTIGKMDKAAQANNDAVTEYTAKKTEDEPVFTPEDTKCDKCGHEFDDADIEAQQKKALDHWRTERAKAMKDLKLVAKEKATEYADLKKLVADAQEAIDKLNDDIAIKEAELKTENDKKLEGAGELQEKLKASKEYQDILSSIEAKAAELNKVQDAKKDENEDQELAELKAKRTQADDARINLRKQQGTKDTYDKIEKEIKDLTKREKELNKTIAELEGLEFAITKYNAARNEVVTKRVNKLFRTDKQGRAVSVKMFKLSADGTKEEEHCELWFDDKPYSALNTAAKIWVGLECINAFNKAFDLYLPVHIDNRESVTDIPEMSPNVQIINLRVVSTGTATVVEY